MKPLVYACALMLTLYPSLQAQQANRAAGKNKPVYRDVVTHQLLVERTRKAVDPMTKMNVIKADDPSKANQPVNLLEQSDIICFNGIATLVPKRAIISAPKKYKDRYQFTDGSKIVTFPDFYAQNRGWVTSLEVSRKQAEGVDGFDEKTTEFIEESGNLIVATYRGGPISVLPRKVPTKGDDGEKPNAKENIQPKIR